MKEKKIRIIPIGGLHAIGGNMMAIEYDNEMIIIDCGITFPNGETPGIDFMIPDFSFILENKTKVKGIIITHGHEDHIGAIPFLLQKINVPVYATKLTLGLVTSRLAERPVNAPTFIEIEPRDVIHIGSFVIEFLRVNHSIIDGVGLAIKTPIGTIIHTGDYKIDYSPIDGNVADLHRFAEYGQQGVLLLISDSTNATNPGYTPSEIVLKKKLLEIFAKSKGRIFVASFASNIHRIQQVLEASQKYNRKVVISGTTMQKNIEIATELGYLKYKKDLIIDAKDIGKYTHKKLVVLCTGSQGEPMSALSRMATGTHKHFRIGAGDTVIITASVIPGNERMVYSVINSLMQMGADVFYEQDEEIHVSGHASQEELKLMITLTQPKYFLPVHGEYRHLKAHASLAESLNIKPQNIIVAQNGDIIELTPNRFEKKGNIPLSTVYVDGSYIGDITDDIIAERKTLASDGVIVISIVIGDGLLLYPPVIIARGFIGIKNDRFMQVLQKELSNTIEKQLLQNASPEHLTVAVKKLAKMIAHRFTNNTPLIETIIQEI
ncbi:MAG TPA: ribonuclease J [Spirochaetota bacterium]|nr:ribonuclease J [Spirochaetota bacterium]HOJ27589.1 ribonuclease J [Spirochaetota bacterium]HOM08671.1 ribonuclease J [Spirochaetota bacterium]HPP48538.1 ribonuclease J [Spirochaetota bacterium]